LPRLARVVALVYPHHVIQRGNRRQPTFFSGSDYEAYLDLMSECAGVWVSAFGKRLFPRSPGRHARPCARASQAGRKAKTPER